MDRYAVIGNPVEHSRSPFIHARFAELTGEVLCYDRVSSPLDGFADTVRAFAAAGGCGCNVTVPFKFDACALAARLTPRASLAGAANILRFDAAGEGWLGDNSDGIGLVRDIEANAGVPIAGCALLLLGAGGAAAGVLGPLLEARPARVLVCNRDAPKAEQLVHRHARHARDCGVELAAGAADAAFDIVVNATSASLQGEATTLLPASALRTGSLAIDLMYGRPARPFVAWAATHGAVARDGLGMLVEQAAEAFFFWRGVRPPTAQVLAELREQLR